MPDLSYQKDLTALVVIDPYNDFISEGGKIWDLIKSVARGNNGIPNMLQDCAHLRRGNCSLCRRAWL